MIPKWICKKGYAHFGKYVFKYRNRFLDIQEYLHRARLPYTLDEYLSGVFFSGVLAFCTSFLIVSVVYVLFSRNILLSLLAAFFFSVFVSSMVINFLLYYPRLVSDFRREEIETRLPYAVTHMATLAGTGIPLVNMFRALTRFKEYGEVARECNFIVKDVELFGKDVFTAMADGAKYTPSKKWGEILWGMISTVRTGGDLRGFLMDKAVELAKNVEREERKAIENIGLLMEIYMVLFVLAPVLGVVMVALMGILGGSIFGISPKVLLIAFVYFIIPMLGVLFLALAIKEKPREII